MKYFKTYEGFKKDYMKKIDLKDFKKIKKGTKLMYMGGPVEVLDNNGYVLKLKGEDGRTFTVNKSQFDHGGMVREGKAPDANKALKDFFAKDDTLSLGVCNGCQLFIELGLLNPEHVEKPKMLHNETGKFECSFTSVAIQENRQAQGHPLANLEVS